ncbi:MAG: hypothetical protein R2769_11710 [Saprospiraceae bacterium]
MKGPNEDETIGIAIVRKALEAPLRTIAENAGVEGSVVLQRVANTAKATAVTTPALINSKILRKQE